MCRETLDRETLIDLFVEHNQEGCAGYWASCEDVYWIFERYGSWARETTSILAQTCRLSYDQIYNRRDAWRLRVATEKVRSKSEISALANALSFSYFARMYKLLPRLVTFGEMKQILKEAQAEHGREEGKKIAAEGIGNLRAFRASEWLLQAKNEGLSIEYMAAEVEAATDGDPLETWRKRARRARRLLGVLWTDSASLGIDERIRKLLHEVWKILEDI